MDVTDGLHPLAALLRRYSFGYTAAHDFSACADIMVEDYLLRMGEHEVRGRDTAYIPATAKQYRQFPGLGFTVHELLLGEDRAALHFTEHGRSLLCGTEASWTGLSLYRWDGTRLTECRVEQDYYGRRTQLSAGVPNPVPTPGLDPWTGPGAPADPAAEAVLREWLDAAGPLCAPAGRVDDEHSAPARRPLLDQPRITVLDLFTAGSRGAFHLRASGAYAGGLADLDGYLDRPVTLYVTGMATVRGGEPTDIRVVTDRLAAERRLTSGS